MAAKGQRETETDTGRETKAHITNPMLCYSKWFSMGPPACIGRNSQEKNDTYTLSQTLEPDA